MYEYLAESMIENENLYIKNQMSILDECVAIHESIHTSWGYFYEDVYTIYETVVSVINNIISFIQRIIREIKAKAKNVFNKIKMNKTKKEIERSGVSSSPIEIPDVRSKQKLDAECRKMIKTSPLEDVQKFYRNNKKKILFGAAGGIIVGMGVAVIYQEKLQKDEDKLMNDMESLLDEYRRTIKEGEERINNYEKYANTAKKMSEKAQLEKEIQNDNMECSKKIDDAITDGLKNSKQSQKKSKPTSMNNTHSSRNKYFENLRKEYEETKDDSKRIEEYTTARNLYFITKQALDGLEYSYKRTIKHSDPEIEKSIEETKQELKHYAEIMRKNQDLLTKYPHLKKGMT